MAVRKWVSESATILFSCYTEIQKNEELPLEISTWNFLSFWSLRLLFTMLSRLKKIYWKEKKKEGSGKRKKLKKWVQAKRRGKSRKMKRERESPGYMETRWEKEVWVDVFNSLFLHSSLNSTGIYVFSVLDMIPLISDVSKSLQNSLFWNSLKKIKLCISVILFDFLWGLNQLITQIALMSPEYSPCECMSKSSLIQWQCMEAEWKLSSQWDVHWFISPESWTYK